MEVEDDRADEEEIFGIVLLVDVLQLLSNEGEETFLEEEDASDAVFTDDFIETSSPDTLDAMDFLKLWTTGDAGTDFLVPEMQARAEGLVGDEGTDPRLSSGRDLLADSAKPPFFLAVGLIQFFVLPPDINGFSSNSPLLFPRAIDIEVVEPLQELVKPDFFATNVESETLLGPTRFLIGALAGELFDPTATLDSPIPVNTCMPSDE